MARPGQANERKRARAWITSCWAVFLPRVHCYVPYYPRPHGLAQWLTATTAACDGILRGTNNVVKNRLKNYTFKNTSTKPFYADIKLDVPGFFLDASWDSNITDTVIPIVMPVLIKTATFPRAWWELQSQRTMAEYGSQHKLGTRAKT